MRSIVDRNVVMRRTTVTAVGVLKYGSADRGFFSSVLWVSPGLIDLMYSYWRV